MEQLPFEKINRKILIKKQAETSIEYGKNPNERSTKELINLGIINLNKPQGPTSHQVSDFVKKILNVSKAGHSGTLDLNVTGVLPIALEDATRITDTLLKAGKEYIALMHLHENTSISKIQKAFSEFQGKIEQLPPIKSAVKRQLRTREIYYIQVLEIEERDVLFKIGCEAGTYIRKYIHDLGLRIGTRAHMTQLIRTKAGPFQFEKSFSLFDLKDAFELYKQGKEEELRKIILPVEASLSHLPKIWVLDTTVDSLCHGAMLSLPGISKLNDNIQKNDLVAILTLKDELVCLGEALMSSENILKEERGIAIKTRKVFMKPDTYPKFIRNK